jgi:hypothetical protein
MCKKCIHELDELNKKSFVVRENGTTVVLEEGK